MLKRLTYFAILCLPFAGLNVSASVEKHFLCPLMIKCGSNGVCKKPVGFSDWKLNPPIKTFSTSFIKPIPTKKITAYFFYGSIYTKFPDDVTVTCLYRDRNGPYLYLEHAGHFTPVLEDDHHHQYQWIDKGYGRYSCTASHPANCPYKSE